MRLVVDDQNTRLILESFAWFVCFFASGKVNYESPSTPFQMKTSRRYDIHSRVQRDYLKHNSRHIQSQVLCLYSMSYKTARTSENITMAEILGHHLEYGVHVARGQI